MYRIALVTVIILHGADNREIRVSPSQITSMQSPRAGAKKDEKLYPEGLNCLINLADGKSVAVVEPCLVIQRMMETGK